LVFQQVIADQSCRFHNSEELTLQTMLAAGQAEDESTRSKIHFLSMQLLRLRGTDQKDKVLA